MLTIEDIKTKEQAVKLLEMFKDISVRERINETFPIPVYFIERELNQPGKTAVYNYLKNEMESGQPFEEYETLADAILHLIGKMKYEGNFLTLNFSSSEFKECSVSLLYNRETGKCVKALISYLYDDSLPDIKFSIQYEALE